MFIWIGNLVGLMKHAIRPIVIANLLKQALWAKSK